MKINILNGFSRVTDRSCRSLFLDPLAEFIGLRCVYVLAIASLLVPAEIVAQGDKFFTANNRQVNVKTFNEQVGKMMKEVGVPGMSLAIIENNEVVYAHGYGIKQLSSGDEVDDETIFEAASLTKCFLTFIVFKLVDQGKLDLDKPMYQYLEHKLLQHDNRYRQITPRMILGHSSGLENWKKYNNPDTLEILSDPGTKYIYSGEGYEYLEQVVALILQKTYEEYLKEMVIEPMKLSRTFSSYTPDGKLPTNYAIGHDSFGKEIKKWKNSWAAPASGMHVRASDYAKLIITTFNGQNLTRKAIREIVRPVIKISPANPSWFYGAGFEVQYTADDTIVFHGGNNGGFKSLVLYSMTKNRGIVFFTNGDRGKAMTKRLSDLTVGLDVDAVLNSYEFEYYPCLTDELVAIYRDHGMERMTSRLGELRKQQRDGRFREKFLVDLAWVFYDDEQAFVKKLMENNLELYPESSDMYYILGQINMEIGQYQVAINNLKKAEQLGYFWEAIQPDLKKCRASLNASK